jgi:hypothetical protein
VEEARADRGDREGNLGRNLAPRNGQYFAGIWRRNAARVGAGNKLVENVTGPAARRPAPQAELSIEISRLVSRILSGETIDTTLSGADLAIRYPDAGMSGEMISQAIVRAAGMVGLIRDGAEAAMPGATSDADQGAVSADDEALSAAISAELEEIMAGEADANGAARMPSGQIAEVAAPREIATKVARPAGMAGAMAAVRRAFFRG